MLEDNIEVVLVISVLSVSFIVVAYLRRFTKEMEKCADYYKLNK
ncbi:MAG: hypothetical protein ABDH32_07445 [Candidatus Caldarchaeales archaeon]